MYNSALIVNMLQSEGQIPVKTVNEISTELVSSLGKYKLMPETSDSPQLLSTGSGKS